MPKMISPVAPGPGITVASRRKLVSNLQARGGINLVRAPTEARCRSRDAHMLSDRNAAYRKRTPIAFPSLNLHPLRDNSDDLPSISRAGPHIRKHGSREPGMFNRMFRGTQEMIKGLSLAGALAAGLIFSPLTVTTAGALPLPAAKGVAADSGNLVEVRKGGGHRMGRMGGRHHFRGGRSFGRSFGHRRGHRHHGDRHHRRGGFGIYIGPSYGYSSCGYLRRKAIRTGSSYWWRRYRNCVN